MYANFLNKLIGISLAACVSISASTLLILDSSGSMAGNESYMKNTVSKNINDDTDIVGFGSTWYNIKKPDDYHINGTTALGDVLEVLNNGNNTKFDYIIIASDGVPDNEAQVRTQAKLLKDSGSKICSTYIAPKNSQIPEILKDISSAVFLTDVTDPISKCQGAVKEKILGHTAVVKHIDINQFAF